METFSYTESVASPEIVSNQTYTVSTIESSYNAHENIPVPCAQSNFSYAANSLQSPSYDQQNYGI